MQLERIEIKKLFGRFDHTISLKRPEKITIILAPNGFGKTAILTMVNAFFAKNIQAFFKFQFEFVLFTFENGETIQIRRVDERTLFPDAGSPAQKTNPSIVITSSASKNVHEVSQPFHSVRDVREFLPSFIESAGPNSWIDVRDDEILSTSELFARYRSALPPSMRLETEVPEWLNSLIDSIDCRLIETQRLLRIGAPSTKSRTKRRTSPHAVVEMEAEDLAERIGLNLVNYATGSQRLDQSFPKRIISALSSYQPPSVDQVAARLAKIEEKRTVLIEAGLIDKSGAPEILSAAELVSPEVRKVMGVYLDDTEDKLSKFDELYARISLFQELITEKFQFKKVLISREAGIVVQADDGVTIPLADLSSGEQHELVMLYDLLFRIRDNALILIDEPELSLHVGWQVQFLPDLQRIQKLKPLQVILATHSPQIINDRWDLTVDLAQ